MTERAPRIVDRGCILAAALVIAASGIGCSKSTNTPDAGVQSTADAASGPADAGLDAGRGDSGAIKADAGGSQLDAGSDEVDGGEDEADAGTLESDAGTVESDAGTVVSDAGARLGTEVVRAAVGAGQGQIGVDSSDESWQAGPMSFSVAPNGEILILDQINSRINVYSNGKWLRSISINGTTYIDMDLMNSSGFVLIDNLVKKKVIVLDTAGTLLHEIALQGSGIPNPSFAVGVQYRGDGIWVEIDDGTLVHVGDSEGAPVTGRSVVQGLFNWDSSRLMRLGIPGDITAFVSISETDKVTWNDYSVYYQSAIMSLLGLYSDADDNYYLGAVFQDDDGVATGAELTVLNSSGEVVRRTPMFAPSRAEEIRRSLRVMGDGTAYQLVLDDKGVAVRRYP
jgi:hypothetical protein